MQPIQIGRASLRFEHGPQIIAAASMVGKKEGEGPFGSDFDVVEDKDEMFGADCWEQAESCLQKETMELVLKKAHLEKHQIRYLFAGDLLGQLMATSFGAVSSSIPMLGLYGACSTMGEAIALGAMAAEAGYGDRVLALASSHFAAAEKQFRFPLSYGNQRPLSATWTVTGCGAVVIASSETVKSEGGLARITGVTIGQVVDLGIRDSMNMGAAMAPAAAMTILQCLADYGESSQFFDAVVTGDLGEVGRTALLQMLREKGIDLGNRHIDCGMLIYDSKKQDTHSGGSGCGCSAAMLSAYLLPQLACGKWKRILFLPTGALLSQVSFHEGESIPGIAHGIILEAV